jgi:hypothetical protein
MLAQHRTDENGNGHPCLAQALQDFPPILVGHHDIQQDQLRVQLAYGFEHGIASVDPGDDDAVACKVALEEVDQCLVVVDDQNSGIP